MPSLINEILSTDQSLDELFTENIHRFACLRAFPYFLQKIAADDGDINSECRRHSGRYRGGDAGARSGD
ncbi:MAG: hypothetical protein H0T45_16505 [Pyrinomonadaceae bacterium]|nr:hypothetical protein [Pyrinomonadaceae bacterium]MDQ3135531.1 hypothetical protein [Acidobacteriota bacterium]